MARGVRPRRTKRRAPGAGAGGGGGRRCWRWRARPGTPAPAGPRGAGRAPRTDARQTFTSWSLRPCAAAPRAPGHGRASGPHAPAARRAPAPRPSPASCAAPGSWDRRHGKLPRYALRVPWSVRGTININPLTSIRPSSEKRWSGGARRARRDPPPGPGPGATRDRHYNGTGLQPPPPRLPRRGPPGAHTRNRAASSVDIMVPFTAFSAV
jgi:hypothetical protein